jgi:hypothetical protein
VRSDDDEIRSSFFSDPEYFGVNARLMGYEDPGVQVIGIDLADQGCKLAFSIRYDRLVAERRGLGLQDGSTSRITVRT